MRKVDKDLRTKERMAISRRIREERFRLDEGIVDRHAARNRFTRREEESIDFGQHEGRRSPVRYEE